MCLAIPGEIVEIDDTTAVIDYGGVRKRASIMALPDANVGEMVIVHAGFVISKIDRDEAQKTLLAFKELEEAIAEENTRNKNAEE